MTLENGKAFGRKSQLARGFGQNGSHGRQGRRAASSHGILVLISTPTVRVGQTRHVAGRGKQPCVAVAGLVVSRSSKPTGVSWLKGMRGGGAGTWRRESKWSRAKAWWHGSNARECSANCSARRTKRGYHLRPCRWPGSTLAETTPAQRIANLDSGGRGQRAIGDINSVSLGRAIPSLLLASSCNTPRSRVFEPLRHHPIAFV